jgi:serine/threonine-protein kinase RsbW
VSQETHKLKVGSSTSNLAKVRSFVERYARETGFSPETVDEFKLAVDEACTNVIEHAYMGDASRSIELSITITPQYFTVIIRDEGRAFEPSVYRSPNLVDLVQQRRDGGFGVHLMRRLMDRVEYRRRGRFNEVALTKYHHREGKNANGA